MNSYRKPANMDFAVLSSLANTATAERVPRSFAAAHPGYGAGALAALDEKLADELAARKACRAALARVAITNPTSAITTTSEHALILAGIDEQLATARDTTKAAKAAYEAALAAERGLQKQRKMVLERTERAKTLKEKKEEKLKRRERAFGSMRGGVRAAAKAVGVGKGGAC